MTVVMKQLAISGINKNEPILFTSIFAPLFQFHRA